MNDRAGRPMRVMFVGAGSDAVPPAVADADAVRVESVVGPDRIPDALETEECLVVALDPDGAIDVVRVAHEWNPDRPIVLYPEEPTPAAASDALRAGATDYLPRSIDEDGSRLLGLIVDAVDRNERWRNEREMFRSLMEEIPLSIFFKDEEARYVAVSQQLRNQVGESMVGKTDVEVWGDEFGASAEEAHEDDLRVLETGEPVLDKVERHHPADSDDPIWVRVTKLPWRDDDGEIQGLIGITEDITDLKIRERELEEQARRLEGFASFASHDLRNPISIAQGYLEVAANAEDPAGAREALENVEDALDRMEDLVSDLLTMVRSDEEDLSTDRVELASVVDEIWMAMDTEAATLDNAVPPGTTIEAAQGQLRQLLSNLFRNAIDHAGPDVEVTVGIDETGFYVEDDGPGIGAEDPQQLFEYGHTDGGTGIGLTIVREVAEAHGWTVEADGAGAGGARFAITDCVVTTPALRDATDGPRVEITDSVDVGGATPPGTTTREGETWTVHGGGEDLWNDIDEHRFAYATLEPPVRVVATVTDLELVHGYSKAGAMVRDDPVAGTALGYVGLSPDHGTEFGWRPGPDEPITTHQFEEFGRSPRTYRLDVLDGRATGYVSTEEGWTAVDQQAVRTEGTVAAGIAVCSHDPERTCEAVFEDVRVVELEPGRRD